MRRLALQKATLIFCKRVGYQAWNIAEGNSIDLSAVKIATKTALTCLDESFFRVSFDRLMSKEREYLYALAKLDSEPQCSGHVAKQLGVEVGQAAPIQGSLIRKGIIYSPAHGEPAFIGPLFAEFMQRTMKAR